MRRRGQLLVGALAAALAPLPCHATLAGGPKPFSAAAGAAEGQWVTTEPQCKVFVPMTIAPATDAKLNRGRCVNGFVEGPAKISFHIVIPISASPGTEKSLALFRATFSHGKAFGKGFLRWAKQVTYVGDFADGWRQGQGTTTRAPGYYYVGHYVRNQLNGYGKWVTPSPGYEYEGQWKNGRITGRGVFTMPTGSVLKGNFVDEQLQGQGQIDYGDYHYKGNFKDGDQSGQGTLVMDGKHAYVYRGHFAKGLPNGQGELDLPGGERRIGHFSDNHMSGPGVIVMTNGDRVAGVFAKDKLVGVGIETLPDGRTDKVIQLGNTIVPFK